MENPVHQSTRADTYWTTVNATEAIPGTATPLTWSFYDDATELALRGTFALMGVLRKAEIVLPEDRDARFIGIFYGHPAANLSRFRLMADLAPGGSGDALEQQFFGTVRSGIPRVRSVRRYPVVAARAPGVLRRVARQVNALHADANAWWRDAVRPGEPDRDRRLVREGAGLYRRILVWHGAGTMLTQGVYDQLGRLCVRAGHDGVEVALVAGLDSIEETGLVADLWALSRGQLDRAAFLSRHGFHGPAEGELSAMMWRERPELLDAQAALLAATAEPPDAAGRRAAAAADEALARLGGRLVQARAAPLLALARHLLPLRETGRGGVLRALDGARAAARRLGVDAADAGVLDLPDDVFFLTIPELAELPSDARERVAERRERHARYCTTRLPEGWWGEPTPLALEAGANGRTAVNGVAGSPGRAGGAARVAHSLESAAELKPGEVLVCRTTDPAWAPLMHVAAALVIDVGGPLSHGAIVARELGVPCVIGTSDGTAAIRTGDRVAVDGDAGTVHILERTA